MFLGFSQIITKLFHIIEKRPDGKFEIDLDDEESSNQQTDVKVFYIFTLIDLWLLCLMSLSTIFHLYCGSLR